MLDFLAAGHRGHEDEFACISWYDRFGVAQVLVIESDEEACSQRTIGFDDELFGFLGKFLGEFENQLLNGSASGDVALNVVIVGGDAELSLEENVHDFYWLITEEDSITPWLISSVRSAASMTRGSWVAMMTVLPTLQ